MFLGADDLHAASRRLSEAIRFKTVTYSQAGKTEVQEFLAFQAWLTLAYPRVHQAFERESFGPWGILLRLSGSNPHLKPILLLAHYDVVPAAEPELWSHHPFEGRLADGFVWGRGSLDVKNTLVSIMEALESLLSQGFLPERGIILAFGGDEEIGGDQGAASIGRRLKELGIEPEFLVDEGAVIVKDMLPFLKRPAALIGISEKGFANIRLEVKGKSGHASMPGRSTAAGALATAVGRLEAHPFPARMTQTLKLFLKAWSAAAPWYIRPIFALPSLFWPIIVHFFSKNPMTDALIRSSQAVTMLEASAKENVLPERAHAIINLRLLPGEGLEWALSRLRRLLGGSGAQISFHQPEHQNEAMAESPVDSLGYRLVCAALKLAAPQALPMPFLVTVGTDTHHYAHLTPHIYRIMPLILSAADLAGIHGVDERISEENLGREIAFYRALIASRI